MKNYKIDNNLPSQIVYTLERNARASLNFKKLSLEDMTGAELAVSTRNALNDLINSLFFQKQGLDYV